MTELTLSHDAWEGYLMNQPEPPLMCPYCRAEVKRFIHQAGGHWVPVWRCATDGDVIAVERRGSK